MQTLFVILIILASVLLSFFVLIQNPKGGVLVSGFAGGTNIMGVKRTGDFLEKMTWGLIITIIVCSLGVNIMGPSSSTSTGGGRADQIDISSPVHTPVLPGEGLPTAPVQDEGTTTAEDDTVNE